MKLRIEFHDNKHYFVCSGGGDTNIPFKKYGESVSFTAAKKMRAQMMDMWVKNGIVPTQEQLEKKKQQPKAWSIGNNATEKQQAIIMEAAKILSLS